MARAGLPEAYNRSLSRFPFWPGPGNRRGQIARRVLALPVPAASRLVEKSNSAREIGVCATYGGGEMYMSWYQEMSKLRAKFEALQRTQRHLLGEDLGPLSVKELQQLEKQLECALSQARQRKTQLMMEQVEALRRKERHLGEMNRQLKHKLEAEGSSNYRTLQHAAAWPAPGGTIVEHDGATYHVHPPAHSAAMDCEPTLQIGYDS
ncbi:hypothetical protein C2845_PM11G30080 [Panicum miliaceum]|uniref:K-box domain-containing protein n=1 Tax=Panicum miliaceum TaxID=4540 RepID=A0A3L6RN11_PANMI|nr:hypothetical protein C2845_PM11G30080 [Panicum miliaceum]